MFSQSHKNNLSSVGSGIVQKTFQDFLADKTSPIVYCTLSLDDKEFLAKNTYSVELHQHTNEHDTFTITVPDDALDSFEGYVMEHSRKLLGKKISINFHRYGEIRQTFNGIIANIRNKKDEGGGYGKLYITGYSPSILLENGKDCQSYENKTLDQIIAEATNEYDTKIKAEGLNTHYPIPYTVQYKESDYQFIKRLAHRYGEYFYYDGQELIFGNKDQDVVPLEENIDLIDIEFEMMIKPQSFKYLAYDSISAEVKEQDADAVQTQYKENLFQAIAVKASKEVFKKKAEMLFNATSQQNVSSDLEQMVKRQKESREHLMQVKGRSRDPKLKIGGKAKLSDINGKAMETYRVLEITHYHDGNEYYNEFVGIPDIMIAPYFDEDAYPECEEQSAIVMQNDDPQGRVKVQFAWQKKKGLMTPWLRVVTPYAGKGKGMHIIPEVGEEVIIGFDNGNAERPFVIGAMFNGKEMSGYGGKGNEVKAIHTRSGTKIVLNDAEGSVKIEDPSGNIYQMDGQGNINVNAPKNIIFTAGENLDVQVGNNLTFNVGNTAMMNIFQKMLINTPFMQQLIADYFHTQAGKALINSDDEIKIEARETNVAGTQRLFMHSDEEATLNSKGVAQLHGEQKNSYNNKAENYETKKEEIKPKCVVYFRPHDKWKGEFGFDWVRMGDSGQKGDIWFGKIMGRYYKESSFSTLFTKTNEWSNHFKKELDMYDRKLRLYTSLQINWKSVKGKPYLYPIPMLTLLKDKTATFNLKLEINEKPKKLTFEFANDDATDYLKLNKNSITDIREGKYTLYSQLTIKCVKEFEEMQILYVKADDEICGAIKIHPNSSEFRKNINVVFVIVKTNINGKIEYGVPFGSAKQVFKNHLNQALVIPNIVPSVILDCTGNDFRNKFCKRKGSKYIFTPPKGKELKNYLELKFKDQHKNISSDYYKLFFIGEENIQKNEYGNEYKVNGFSFEDSKFGVYFKGHNESTIAHEIMHAMNLPHTFASVDKGTLLAKFTYQAGQTNNIMDYSHWSSFENKPRITTYHWQWKVLNPKILDLHRGMGIISRLKKWFNNF